jgi:hypothetical protein
MDLEESIETIEAGYEFLLAYAAQGRPASDETDGPGPHARPTIESMVSAMANIIDAFSGSENDFEQVIASDCKKASAALTFLVSQKKIGSEVVDNLNASIHLRALPIQRSSQTFVHRRGQRNNGLRRNEKTSVKVR